MKFLTERCYTALNADELEIGSKVIVADTIDELKQYVEDDCDTSIITNIMPEYYAERFNCDDKSYNLAYLVSTPKEKNWIVYLHRGSSNPEDYYLTSCRSDRWETVKKDYGAKTKLFEGTEDECENWYTSRRQFADIIAAWEDGKTIQYNSGNGWEDCCDNRPVWDVTIGYRIKPEGLKWTDLKLGDVIQNKNHTHSMMVIGIDYREGAVSHIFTGAEWFTDEYLENWEKVE